MNIFNHGLCLMGTAILAAAAKADVVRIPIWSQDFESPETYTNELHYGRIACNIIGVSAAIAPKSLEEYGQYEVFSNSWTIPSYSDMQNYKCKISPEIRTSQVKGVDAGTSTYMRAYARGKEDIDLMFILPTDTVSEMNARGEYILEFDYYLGPSYTNGNNSDTNGLVIATSDGDVMAVFCTKPKDLKAQNAKYGQIYTLNSVDSLAVDGIAVGARGSFDTKGLWVHFSIHASEGGVFMSATQESGAELLSDERLSDSFAVVDRLYMRTRAKAYDAALSLDNVIVSIFELPEEPLDFVWTNGSGDGAWGNKANWSVEGIDNKISPPRAIDTVVFPADGSPWTVTLDYDVTVTNFVADGAVAISNALVYTAKVEGDAPIILAGDAGFHTRYRDVLSITNNIIVMGTGNKFKTYDNNQNYGGIIDIYGDVSGDGEISLVGQRCGFGLYGNWMDFAGTVNVVKSGSIRRNATLIHSPLATSSNAVWNVDHSDEDSYYILRNSGQRYYFGALNGYIWQKSNSYNSWLEVGALGVDCAFGGKLGATSKNHIDKVGPGKLTFTGSDIGNVDIHGGTFIFGGTDSMASGEIRFLGDGILAVDAFKNGTAEYLDPSPFIKNSTFPVSFSNAVGEVHIWASLIDSSNTGGLVKRGAGTLVLKKRPKHLGVTIVEEGTLIVPTNTAFEELIVHDGATVLYEDPDVFVWTGAVDDDAWSSIGNWGIRASGGNGDVVAPATASPGANDIVRFMQTDTPWDVVLDGDVAIDEAMFSGPVRFTGAKTLTANAFAGDGRIILAGAGLAAGGRVRDFDLGTDIEIEDGTENTICAPYYGTDAGDSVRLHLRGRLSGSGMVTFTLPHTNQRGGTYLWGDNTAFSGIGVFSRPEQDRSTYRFMTPKAVGTNAHWETGKSPTANGSNGWYIFDSSIEKEWVFGAIDGTIYHYNANGAPYAQDVQLLIGSRPENSRLGGTWAAARGYSSGCGVEWVSATNTLTYSAAKTAFVRISGGGTVVIADKAALPIHSSDEESLQDGEGIIFENLGGVLKTEFDPSGVLNGSTSLICFDDEGVNRTWGNAIKESNSGGFTKRGAGTLTLALSPLYGGLTTVEEGKIIVSNAFGIAVGPKTRSTVDECGTATLVPTPTDAVAMAGAVSFTNFYSALNECLENSTQTLTLLASAENISIPIDASIKLRDMGHEFSFATADRCRIDTNELSDGAIIFSHVWDIVSVKAPEIPNATLFATTNGVALVLSDDGTYHVLRHEQVDFEWRANDCYTLNADAMSIAASCDANSIPAEDLPFAMRTEDIDFGRVLRLVNENAAVDAPSALDSLSVETSCTLRIAETLAVSNVVFTTGSQLTIEPGGNLGDADALIAWKSPHSLDCFVLAADAIAEGWMLRAELDGLKLYKASRCSLNGVKYSYMEDAFAASSDGDTVCLEVDSWLFDRIDMPPGESRTLDLGGHTLKVASLWLVNVGESSFSVSNGNITCSCYGFYVTDGDLSLSNCRVDATGRVVQIRGAGNVDIAPDATLVTSGNDPVVFAIGGVNGRAEVVSQGRLVQQYEDNGGTTAYCIAGNPDDTFGANIGVKSSSGMYFTTAADECLYHPFLQGGRVDVSAGWFSLAPREEWLATGLDLREEALEGFNGWRVFLPMPVAADLDSMAAIFADCANSTSLAANITTLDEYGDYSEWVRRESSFDVVKSSAFAWMSYALDAPALLARAEPLVAEDVEIAAFSSPGPEGIFSLNVGIKDVEIGADADCARLTRVFGLSGSASLDPKEFSDLNVTLIPDGTRLERGRVGLTAKPTVTPADAFFMRVYLKP